MSNQRANELKLIHKNQSHPQTGDTNEKRVVFLCVLSRFSKLQTARQIIPSVEMRKKCLLFQLKKHTPKLHELKRKKTDKICDLNSKTRYKLWN